MFKRIPWHDDEVNRSRFTKFIDGKYSLLHPRHRPRGRLTEEFASNLKKALGENPLIALHG